MASGGKGGSTSSSVQIPDWIKQPAQRNLARAEQAAQVGYMPWYGPDVAAATPQQLSAMQASNTAAQAFGLAPKGQAFDSGLPQAQEFAGGVRGYSSAPLFEQALGELRAKNPDQMARYDSLYNGQYLNQNPSTAGKYQVTPTTYGGDSSVVAPSNAGSMNWGDPFAGGVTATSSPGLLGSIANTAALGSAVIGNTLGIDSMSGQNSGNMAPVVNMGGDSGFGGYGGVNGTGAGYSSADADAAFGGGGWY